MEYPINYDFGKNWEKKIIKHLDNPKLKRALKKSIDRYRAGFPHVIAYEENTCPAEYSSMDVYAQLQMRMREEYIKELIKMDKMLDSYKRLKTRLKKLPDGHPDEDDVMYKIMEMENEITDSLFSWKNIKYNLESYCVYGSAYYYAPTFELTLAKLVEPNEEWVIRKGHRTCTVINKNGTKIFDLIYWSLDGRLENHIFGDELHIIDPTLGGKEAYIDSS